MTNLVEAGPTCKSCKYTFSLEDIKIYENHLKSKRSRDGQLVKQSPKRFLAQNKASRVRC